MSEDTTNHKTDSSESDTDDEMLDEYDFSQSKPGRYRGAFRGRFVRVLEDGTEIVIEYKSHREKMEPGQNSN